MVLISLSSVCSMLLKPLWAVLRMGTQRWILVCIGTLDRLIAVFYTVIRFIVGLLENVLLARGKKTSCSRGVIRDISTLPIRLDGPLCNELGTRGLAVQKSANAI